MSAAAAARLRSLHEICEDVRRGQCGYCSGMPGEPCVSSGTGPDGFHAARFAWAEAHALITDPDLTAVLGDLDAFTAATIIWDTDRPPSSAVTVTAGQAGVIARALTDAIAYRTALTAGCPDCAEAAPEGCPDHREDAARAAGYERMLRSLVTGQEAG